MDAVDQILDQWRAARPDLDTAAMGPIGRFLRVAQQLSRGMGETFARHGLNSSSFDVLATLRRAPPPRALSAGELMSSMMITSGTMTNRLDQLEKAGLIERKTDQRDGRRAVIQLSPAGFDLIDRVVVEHTQTQSRLLAGLSAEETAQLNGLLRKLLGTLSPDAGG